MSIVVETYLFCDGGAECPRDAAANADGLKQGVTATEIRRQAEEHEGWVRHGRRDFCTDCAKRLGYSSPQ